MKETAEKIKIRPAEKSDLSRVKDLLRATGVFSSKEIEVAGELLESASAGSRDYEFLVAEGAGGVLSGIACWGPVPLTRGTYDLYWIAVAPSEKNRSLGGRLLDRVAADVRKRDGRLLVAETSSRASYRPARAFYRGKGFSRAAVIPGYYAPGDDLVIFVKELY